MRDLARPKVLKWSAAAALVSAAVCYPELSLWTERAKPLWYLESLLCLGGTVLWAFVFAWFPKYANRPVFTLRAGAWVWSLATFWGLATAIVLYRFVDPALHAQKPLDYPANVEQWFARTLFSLAFIQLVMVFAPFSWLLRLTGSAQVAAMFTVLFGGFVLAFQHPAAPAPVPVTLLLGMLAQRLLNGAFSVYFFLRGGVVLVWWWHLLLQSRHWWRIQSGW